MRKILFICGSEINIYTLFSVVLFNVWGIVIDWVLKDWLVEHMTLEYNFVEMIIPKLQLLRYFIKFYIMRLHITVIVW